MGQTGNRSRRYARSDTDKLEIAMAGNRATIRVMDSDADEQHWRIRVRVGHKLP